MRRAKEAEPSLTVGYIAGAALGDLAGLDVDFLMVSARLATRRFVREAHARGMEVHPWTVNDAATCLPLLDRGVDNVITDAPAAMRARLEEIRALRRPSACSCACATCSRTDRQAKTSRTTYQAITDDSASWPRGRA